MSFEGKLLGFMKRKAYLPMNCQRLAEAMGVEPRGLAKVLKKMVKKGLVAETRSGCFGLPKRMNLIVGVFSAHPRGHGVILPEANGDPKVCVPEGFTGDAMNGDSVIARVHRNHVAIVDVLHRANRKVVGTYQKGHPSCFVKPDDRRLNPIAIPPDLDMQAASGERVVVEILRWPEGHKDAQGRVVRKIGPVELANTDFQFVIERHGLRQEFPKEVLAETEGLTAPSDRDMEGRLDLRSLPLVTIDGEDARDFDDAVSLEETQQGYRLGVHIADVSYYVREGSRLDREALRRGTSVYLVEAAVPMLPERLSTDLCSLIPNENRLAVSVFMDFDKDGEMIGHNLARSIIRSRERLTYASVDQALESGKGARLSLGAMARLSEILRRRRWERGALDLETLEQEITLDSQGNPLDIQVAKRYRSHSIIEEFMLSANELIARLAAARGVPFIYRVHEEPDPSKLELLADLLFRLGYRKKRPKKAKAGLIREALEMSKAKPEERLIDSFVLRSLKIARYDTQPSPHFGLHIPLYCHFTAPIRRYPDLAVHRVVCSCLIEKMASSKTSRRWQKTLPKVALLSSERERQAQEAERDSFELKTLRYMANRIGETFPGLISGVMPYGLYVEIENGAEGLVHVSEMEDDYYCFNEETQALKGQRTRKRYRLGDPVRVKVVAVNIEGKTLDFVLDNP